MGVTETPVNIARAGGSGVHGPSVGSVPRVVAVVLNCNGRDLLDATLRDLATSGHPDLHVCVVDNASTDGSADHVRARFPGVHLIASDRNLGWAAGNNLGIHYALREGADHVWLLNNDIHVGPECLPILLAHMVTNPATGLASPAIYYYDEPQRLWYGGGSIDWQAYQTGHTESVAQFAALPLRSRFICGCAMLVRRRVFECVGLIDERFFIYCEDADLSVRAASAGFGLEVIEGARLYHKVGAFSAQVGRAITPFQAYHTYRSALQFWRKHLGRCAYHRGFWRSAAGSRVSVIGDYARDGATEDIAAAMADALWYAVSGQNRPLERPKAPAWFAWLVRRRPALVRRLLSFQL